MRPGVAMSRRGVVAPVMSSVWLVPMVIVQRVRLWARAARQGQAALALNSVSAMVEVFVTELTGAVRHEGVMVPGREERLGVFVKDVHASHDLPAGRILVVVVTSAISQCPVSGSQASGATGSRHRPERWHLSVMLRGCTDGLGSRSGVGGSTSDVVDTSGAGGPSSQFHDVVRSSLPGRPTFP